MEEHKEGCTWKGFDECLTEYIDGYPAGYLHISETDVGFGHCDGSYGTCILFKFCPVCGVKLS